MMSFLEASASELSLVEREMLIQAIKREPALLKFFMLSIRPYKSVTHTHWNMTLISIRPEKCATRQ